MGERSDERRVRGDGKVDDFDHRRTKPVEESSSGKHSADDRAPKKDDDDE